MKGRIELHMSRVLPNGILDSFTVYCTNEIAENVRQKYKAMGYTVTG